MGVGMVLKVGRLKASSMSRRSRRTEIPKASRGFPPPQQGGRGEFLRNLCVNWCILERKSLLKLIGQIHINIAFITTSVRLNLKIFLVRGDSHRQNIIFIKLDEKY